MLSLALVSTLVLLLSLIFSWFDFSSSNRDFACESVGFNLSMLADLLVEAL